MQQADPGSSSSSESLGHGDRDSSLVAAIGGENSRKDGVTKSGWGECKKNLQRDPLPLHSARGGGWGDDFTFLQPECIQSSSCPWPRWRESLLGYHLAGMEK